MQKTKLFAALLAASAVTAAWAAPTAEQIKQLGTTLTPWGAEIAGNKDGTIPAYTGGAPRSPAGFDEKSGKWLDLYANDKPLYSVTAANLAQYASKLTQGTIEMIKRYPSYRVDVYPTRRSAVAQDKLHADAAIKNAKNPECKTEANGVGMRGCAVSTPFPIPSNGYEVMWNSMPGLTPNAAHNRGVNLVIDTAGNLASPLEYTGYILNAWTIPGGASYEGDGVYGYKTLTSTESPARDAGNSTLLWYSQKKDTNDDRAWSYTTGQRRVRLAPEFAYDTPIAALGGTMFYDEPRGFAGRMDRFDFKLLGKQEMIVPYNSYKAIWGSYEKALSTKNHMNPDYMRWELHRVWVVEATLKQGVRRAASKRRFYVDEDSWNILASEGYDQGGRVFRNILLHTVPNYSANSPGGLNDFVSSLQAYDLARGSWVLLSSHGFDKAFYRLVNFDGLKNKFQPQAMAGSGVR